jgi:preprotein translocase subunit Sss1
MPSTAMVSGVLLILLGIIGYIFGLMHDAASPTALIPTAFGLLLFILGAVAKKKENLRMHLMHAAVLIGLVGFAIPAWRVLSTLSNFIMSTAIVSQLAMALICLVFVILCVKSFIDARRNRAV